MAPSPPLCIDLFCGRFGWGRAFAAEGYRVIGFDIEHLPHHGPVPEGCQLVLQDVRTLHGSQFKHAAVIVASSPCQRYSYMAMPWDRAKREIRWQEWQRTSPFSPGFDLNELFEQSFRLQREASEAAGRYIPLVVENVKGAQRWVGSAKWHYGSYYLWGDVPALMPMTLKAAKIPGQDWNRFKETGEVSPHWRLEAEGMKRPGRNFHAFEAEGVKQRGSGREWFAGEGTIGRTTTSGTPARKAASAMIAEIPFDLAQWIARVFKPETPSDERLVPEGLAHPQALA